LIVTALWDEWNFTLAVMRVLWVLGILTFSAGIALVLGRRSSPVRRAYRRAYSTLLQSLSFLFFAAGFCTVPLFHLAFREPLSRMGILASPFPYNLLCLIAATILVLLAYCTYCTYCTYWSSGHPSERHPSALTAPLTAPLTGPVALAGLGVLFLTLTGLEWLGMWDMTYHLGSWGLEVRSGIWLSPWIALAVAMASFAGAVSGATRRHRVRIAVMVLILAWLALILWSAASSAAVAATRSGGRVSPEIPPIGLTTSFVLLAGNIMLFVILILVLALNTSVTLGSIRLGISRLYPRDVHRISSLGSMVPVDDPHEVS